jgi:ribosomal protein S8
MTNHHISDLIARINNAAQAALYYTPSGPSASLGGSATALREPTQINTGGRVSRGALTVEFIKTKDTLAVLNVLQQEGLLQVQTSQAPRTARPTAYGGGRERKAAERGYITLQAHSVSRPAAPEGAEREATAAAIGPLFTKIKVISKPGRRVFIKAADPRPKGASAGPQGGSAAPLGSKHGVSIIRTSQGFMTTRDANILGLGGELILNVR